MGKPPVPAKATTWPIYVVSAALQFHTPRGPDVRSIHGVRMGPSPEAAKAWFLECLSDLPAPALVIDVAVSEVPREMLRIAVDVEALAPTQVT